jgi:hypothetical protein
MQYDYLYASVRRRKRFDKWVKPEEKDEELVQSVMARYGIGRKRADEYISLLDQEAREKILKARGGSR